MTTAVVLLTIFGDEVTSWPREGVALLVALIILFALAAVVVRLRGGGAAPSQEVLDLPSLPPPSPDPAADEREPHDI